MSTFSQSDSSWISRNFTGLKLTYCLKTWMVGFCWEPIIHKNKKKKRKRKLATAVCYSCFCTNKHHHHHHHRHCLWPLSGHRLLMISFQASWASNSSCPRVNTVFLISASRSWHLVIFFSVSFQDSRTLLIQGENCLQR